MKVKALVIALCSTVVVGCATKGIDQAETEIKSAAESISDQFQNSGKFTENQSSVSIKNEYWIGGKAFPLSDKDKLPEFFHNPVGYFVQDPVTFQDIISELSDEIGYPIILSSDAVRQLTGLSKSNKDSKKTGDKDSTTAKDNRGSANQGLAGSKLKFQIQHQGTIRSLLDTISNKANLSWKWKNNQIVIFHHETRTFIVDSLPGITKFRASVNSNGETKTKEAGTSGKSELATFTEYTPEDPFKDLATTLEAFKSTSGVFSVSGQTGTITFTDTPRVLDNVSKYVKELNTIINTKLAIQTEIYEVTVDDSATLGIDWDVVLEGATDVSLSLNSPFTSAGDSGSMLDMGIVNSDSKFAQSKAIMNSLRKFADVSLVTSSKVFTTNGQPVPIQVMDTTAYLKKVGVIRDDESGAVIGMELTPGTTNEGISMSLLPKVTSEGDVLMQVSMDLSLLNEMKEFGGDEGKIQLPSRSVKNFMQRVNIDSGETLLLSGFERTVNRSTTSTMLSKEYWGLGGKRSGGQQRVMTLIMITPYVMAK